MSTLKYVNTTAVMVNWCAVIPRGRRINYATTYDLIPVVHSVSETKGRSRGRFTVSEVYSRAKRVACGWLPA